MFSAIPMATLALRRILSSASRASLNCDNVSGNSQPTRPRSCARTNTQGLPASTIDTSKWVPRVCSSSVGRPVGRSLPVAPPPGLSNTRLMGAPEPATPGRQRSPLTPAAPSSSENVERIIRPVLTLRIRTQTWSPFTETRPSSTANGPTAAAMLPQLAEESTMRLRGDNWKNR